MLERLKTMWGVLFPPTIEFLTGNNPNPTKAYPDDACDDVKACGNYTLYPHKKVDIVSDRSANIPKGYFIDIRPRSGLSSQGINLANTPSTIDSGYTGNWYVPLINNTEKVVSIHDGERIAQFRLVRIQRWKGKKGTKAKESARGTNKYGSSGTK